VIRGIDDAGDSSAHLRAKPPQLYGIAAVTRGNVNAGHAGRLYPPTIIAI
jgi:hypothetical protein